MSPLWTKRTSGFALKGADACKRTPDREQRLALAPVFGVDRIAHCDHDFQAFGIAWQYRWGGGF